VLPTLVRRQLVALLLITVLGGAYVLYQFVDLPRLVGAGRFTVTVELADTGGLYAGGKVTYRGREVGDVTDVALSDDAVLARIGLDDGVRIPRALVASVRSTSAVGEQYLDLVPQRADGPVLADGDVVPRDRTRLPTPTSAVLASATSLVGSVPTGELSTVLAETHTALDGASTDLATLLDSSHLLAGTLRANVGPTTSLVDDLAPVLATQQRLRPEIASSARDLASVTEVLRDHDAALRGVVEHGGPLADETDALVRDLRPTLPMLLADVTGVARVTSTYTAGLRQALILFPIGVNEFQASANSAAAAGSPDLVRADVGLTLNDPPPCTTGYPDPSTRRDPQDLTARSAATEARCREPAGSPIGVRTSRDYPCPVGSPAGPGRRSPDARGCGLDFQSIAEELAQRRANIAVQDDVAARNPRHPGEPQRPPGPDSPALPDPPVRPGPGR
jgi:phospholipid/cholesterol/gamma-HCH transport system substrate-binding protein